MKANPAKPGHLKDGELNLKCSDQVRGALSKATKRHYSLKKIKLEPLGWKRKA